MYEKLNQIICCYGIYHYILEIDTGIHICLVIVALMFLFLTCVPFAK